MSRPPRRAIPIVIVLAVLALVSGWVLRGGSRSSETEQRLARWRSAGLPMTPAEVNVWYSQVPGPDNLGPGVLDAMLSIRFDARSTNLPVAARGANPPPGRPFSPGQLAVVREFHATNAAAVAAMRKALERPRCRFSSDFNKGYLTTLPHLSTVKSAGNVLALEARLASEEGLGTEALALLTNGMHLAAAVEREPTTISFLVAATIRNSQVAAAEHVLGRGVLKDRDLATLQRVFLADADTSTLTPAIVGEAANYSALLQSHWRTVLNLGGLTTGQGSSDLLEATTLQLYWVSGFKERDRRVGIRFFDQMLAVSEAPMAERARLAREAEAGLEKSLAQYRYPIARMLLPGLAHVWERHIRTISLLRAAATACAVERYRLAHGDALPETLEALVPTFMPSVPLDPWTQQPLHYRKLSPGYVIYGVGEDGNDDNGVSFGNRPKGSPGGYDDTFTVVR